MGEECSIQARNSLQANLHPKAVDDKLSSELINKRIAGPFKTPPFPNFKVSPLSIREKSEPGKFRLLHNLSYPYDSSSVNGGIPQQHKTVTYATVQTAITKINQLGKNCFLAKADIQSAYRMVPIHPSQYHLLGFKWRDNYYYDKFLPMGMAESCAIFELISDSIVHIMHTHGIKNIVKVLDDFLILEKTQIDCNCSLQKFIYICSELGIPLVPEKTSKSSSTNITFLGVELDTIAMTAKLPPEKLLRYGSHISSLLSAESTTLRELQTIIGKLQFATCVIPVGKPFLRRLIDATKGHSVSSAIRITEEMRADLSIWQSFLLKYNGISVITSFRPCDSHQLGLFSDASNDGFAGIYAAQWIQGKWNSTWKLLNIAVRELYPIVALTLMFGHLWRNHSITLNCDNQAIVAVINKHRARNPTIMILLRPLILFLMTNNIKFKAVYIKSKTNVIADAISRFQEDAPLLQSYGMRPSPTPVPDHLRPEAFIQA